MTAVALETGVRFSKSLLWEAQRRYYDTKGVAAWRTNAVPHYVTNTPALAQAYAEVVLGLLRDLDAGAWGSLDPRQPLYVAELGAGTGRFGFLFLTALEKLRRATPEAGGR